MKNVGRTMMLKEFKFGNFRSFKEIQTLSMEPMSISRPDLDCFNISDVKIEVILTQKKGGKGAWMEPEQLQL